jgi:hypothetical protein
MAFVGSVCTTILSAATATGVHDATVRFAIWMIGALTTLALVIVGIYILRRR